MAVSFGAAHSRLANLAGGGTLARAAHEAYGSGTASLLRVGVAGVPGLSKLVEVVFGDMAVRADSARLPLRWQATGPGGGIFPVLDADITLTPAADSLTVMRIDAAYRPPLGAAGASLDRMMLHRVATGTMRDFLGRVADRITRPEAATSSPEASPDAGTGPAPVLDTP